MICAMQTSQQQVSLHGSSLQGCCRESVLPSAATVLGDKRGTEAKKHSHCFAAWKLTFFFAVFPLTWNGRYLQLQSSELQNREEDYKIRDESLY